MNERFESRMGLYKCRGTSRVCTQARTNTDVAIHKQIVLALDNRKTCKIIKIIDLDTKNKKNKMKNKHNKNNTQNRKQKQFGLL